MLRFYCGAKSRYLTREYMERHHCRCVRKGHNRGRLCRFLIKQEDGSFNRARDNSLVASDAAIDRHIKEKRRQSICGYQAGEKS